LLFHKILQLVLLFYSDFQFQKPLSQPPSSF
jgi:hypothetical protein